MVRDHLRMLQFCLWCTIRVLPQFLHVNLQFDFYNLAIFCFEPNSPMIWRPYLLETISADSRDEMVSLMLLEQTLIYAKRPITKALRSLGIAADFQELFEKNWYALWISSRFFLLECRKVVGPKMERRDMSFHVFVTIGSSVLIRLTTDRQHLFC